MPDPIYYSTTIDSYVTLIEAEAFLASRPDAESWNNASDSMKISALVSAKDIIDALPLRGTRYESEYIYNGSQKDTNSDGLTQTMEFPREIDGVVCDLDHGTGLPIVPNRVKKGCCLVALGLIDDLSDSGSMISEKELIAKGITSFSLGRLSMSFGAGADSKYFGLPNKKSYDQLNIYIEHNPMVL